MKITCEMCEEAADFAEFEPNLTSMHNAIRCRSCGSTKNKYNAVHSSLISRVMAGKLKGPVDHEMVLSGLREEG